MKSSIITIGDELLIGQVVNTNASYIAGRLNVAGIEVIEILTVGDGKEAILTALESSFSRYDVTILTGGLGPTHDDVTRDAVCTFFSTELYPDPDVRSSIERLLKQRNQPWTPAAESQTLVPRGCTVIPNPVGTAPGQLFERENRYVVVLPGVPYEMKAMIDGFVMPYFSSRSTGKVIMHRTLRTTGIPESVLAARLGDIDEIIRGGKLAFLPSPTGVRMRITVVAGDATTAASTVGAIEQRIRSKAERYIYGVEEEELEEVVGHMLAERCLKIAVAESCTGGLLLHKLTNVPGSSSYVERGIVAYSNRSKVELLGVPQELLDKHGAVSGPVAKVMAGGIRTQSGADIGLATTGIAGPAGGSDEKPVGLVWIGYADARDTLAIEFRLGEGRSRVKERAAQAALELVRRRMLNIGE